MKTKKLTLLLPALLATANLFSAAEQDHINLQEPGFQGRAIAALEKAKPFGKIFATTMTGATMGYLLSKQLKKNFPIFNPYVTPTSFLIGGIYGNKAYKNFKTIEIVPHFPIRHSAFFIGGICLGAVNCYSPKLLKEENLKLTVLGFFFLELGLIKLDEYFARDTKVASLENLPTIQENSDDITEENCYICFDPLLNNAEKETILVPITCKCKASKYLHKNCLTGRIRTLPSGQVPMCEICKAPLNLKPEKKFKHQAVESALAVLS